MFTEKAWSKNLRQGHRGRLQYSRGLMVVTFPKRVMMMVDISDGIMVDEEQRWTSHDDILEARDEGGAGGEE